MNILTISTNYSRGGAALIARNIYKSLKTHYNSEFNSKFLYAFDKGGKQNIIEDDIIALPYDHKYIPHLNYLSHKISGKDIFKAQEDKLDTIIRWADIIHIHIIHTHGFNYEQLVDLINRNKKKVIITLHDSWFYTGRCAIIANCNEWRSGCQICPHLDYYPSALLGFTKSEFQKKVNSFSSINDITFVSPSKWIAANLQLVYPNKKIKVIKNGIDTSNFSIIENDRENLTFVIVANNFSQDIKIDISILTKIIENNFKIHFIGSNAPFISKNVINHGYITDKKEYLNILQKAHIMLFLSKIDNFPTVLIEGLCAGLHIAIVESKGAQEVLEEFDYTIIGEPKTFIELLNKTEFKDRIFSTQNRYKTYLHAKEKFKLLKMVNSYIALYKNERE